MPITISGSGTITGLTAGGLPDGSIAASDLADNAVTAGKLASTLDLTGKTVTLPAGTGGKILQVVTTDYTGLFSTPAANSWTQVSGLDRSITLSSNSSTVLIIASLGQVSSASDVGSAWDLRRDGTALLQGVADSNRPACTFKVGCYQASHAAAASFIGIDSPGSSGTKTYQVWCRAQGGTTLYLNRTNNNEDANETYAARPASHLTLLEIA